MATMHEVLEMRSIQAVHEAAETARAINEKSARLREVAAEAKAAGCSHDATALNLFHTLAAAKVISEAPQKYSDTELGQFIVTARDGVGYFSQARAGVSELEAAVVVAAYELLAELAGAALLYRGGPVAAC
jgi:hypothetical protein